MRLMGLEAIYRRPRTTTPHRAHPVHPYLLNGLSIDLPNQVWCSDIAFIPVRGGFLYLVAIIGKPLSAIGPRTMASATPKVLSWRLSNTMHASFRVEALEEALADHGPLETMNTDQGSRFTGADRIATLTVAGVRVSVNGRGRCMDNVRACLLRQNHETGQLICYITRTYDLLSTRDR